MRAEAPMKRYQITLDGRTFDVRLLSEPLQDQVEVEVNGQAFLVEVQTLLPSAEPTAAVSTATGAPTSTPQAMPPQGNAVIAPLPGVIKSIAVRPGQQVAIGDELLIIEAMKMDNVIRAAREGIVETIYIAEGHQVAHGELMLEYRS
jgi:biotin carboxyl carrier protein